MADVATPEQIAEYESQLENIKQLLEVDPQDESLLALKNDLEELLHLTRAQTNDIANNDSDEAALDLPPPPLPPPPPPQPAIEGTTSAETEAASAAVAAGEAAAAAASEDTTTKSNNKKKQKVKDFVVPPHLIANEADTEAEKNRKNRKLKALKNKWREKKKEVVSVNRQNAWQSFQKKSKRKDAESIFSTKEGVNDRVGVISKKEMTEFGSRKRHKK